LDGSERACERWSFEAETVAGAIGRQDQPQDTGSNWHEANDTDARLGWWQERCSGTAGRSMSYWAIISCGLLGMGIVFLVVPLALKSAAAKYLSHRARDLHHTHQTPVPRLGGLALAAAFIGIEVFIEVMYPERRARMGGRPVVLISSLAMFALGFWDDVKPLGARRKLLGQILIAAAVCAFGIGIQAFKVPFSATIIDLGNWGVLITVLWLVGMTNLINLIDGVDGLAGGICLMLMVLLAYVGHQSGSFELLASGMAGALLAFLCFNFPPARIYLGDGGAYFLGFQIGLFAILSSHKGTVFAALAAPLFVLALPIIDTALAILRRGLRGLPIFRPDRRHLHHHLLDSGLSRRKVVLYFYAVTLVFLVMGFAAFWSRGHWIPALAGVGTLMLLLCAGKLNFSRHWFAVGRVVGDSLEMRQEIHYALTLMRWLELEGGRRGSTEELWGDLIFAAQRLGFTFVKLTLADGQRVWEETGGGELSRSVVEVLQGGRFGTLELKAPFCPTEADPAQRTRECDKSFCPCVSDGRVFEIVSELLAEGWVKAAGKLSGGDQTALRFDTKLSAPRNRLQHRCSRSFAPAPVPEAGPKPATTP
jgi:UDP-GlcNAc:undecaprenyl-phosphate GlcNAc-1-phosphate transferase